MLRRSFLAAPALLPFAAHAGMLDATASGLRPDSGRDESAALQALLREASRAGRPLSLDRGTYVVSNLELPSDIEVVGLRPRGWPMAAMGLCSPAVAAAACGCRE